MSDDQLVVTSHVGRDLQQSAQLFNTDVKVVWEYVSNSLQYVDQGVAPVVRVVLDGRNRRISVSDNGRGMTFDELRNYFVMHGENADRLHGRPGRGFFGTGKSAAFGIADTLRVSTVSDGRLSVVELGRADMASEAAAFSIPVRTLKHEEATTLPSGTTVEIENVHLQRLDEPAVIAYIERQLGSWRDAVVFVNGRQCEYQEPLFDEEWIWDCDSDSTAAMKGVRLTVRKACAPLGAALRGIAIQSNGVVHEITLGTSEGKEMSQYLFGVVDVPALDSDGSTPSPFTMARSGELNRSNALVREIFAFIDPHISEVRQKLVDEDRERRASEESRRLQKEADKVSQVLNDDFRDFRDRLARARARAGGAVDPGRTPLEVHPGDGVLFGDELPAVPDPMPGWEGANSEGHRESPDSLPHVEPEEGSPENLGAPAATGAKNRRTASSGFAVEFRALGEGERRAVYEPDSRTILVNLNHPQLRALAASGGTEDPGFLRLAYEVAFAEYSVALAQELNNRGHFYDVQDALFEIRDAQNRLARRAAGLFATGDFR